MRPYPEIVQSLAGKAAEMLPLSKSLDGESLATLSAKRRFFKVFLEVEQLHVGPIPAELIQTAESMGENALAQYLRSIQQIRAYADSEARKKWNPNGAALPLVSFDWFVNTDIPAGWDAMDFLSRCERIFTDQGFTGEGKLFTRIFDYRVTLHAGYEDGMRLCLTRTEVGEYVKPLVLSSSDPVKVEPWDLVRRLRAYSGMEPNDYNDMVEVPMGKLWMRFSFMEIDANRFANLEKILGNEAFMQIVKKMGYKVPEGPFETWTGDDKLPLTYYVREGDVPGAKMLILVGWGEYQPGRYIANIEGFWRVYNADFT